MASRYAPPPSVGGPTREIRMVYTTRSNPTPTPTPTPTATPTPAPTPTPDQVYHNKHGGSRVSIFRSGESSFSYNPITHQRTHNQAGTLSLTLTLTPTPTLTLTWPSPSPSP